MAAEKTITITVTEGKFNTEMKGFVNKAEGLAFLTLAAKTVMAELLQEVADRQGEILQGIVNHGACTCPACEARAAMGLLQ